MGVWVPCGSSPPWYCQLGAARPNSLPVRPASKRVYSFPAMATQTMRTLVKHRAGPGLRVDRRRVPSPGTGEVLIRVRKAGICGTDLHIFHWDAWAQGRVRPGIVVGHEFMGEVAAVGPAVRCVHVGDRVTAEGHIGCGACYYCRTGQGHVCDNVSILGVDRDGCFAEYVLVPEANVWRLHPAIPDRWGAIHDPLGNAVHTVMAGEGVSGRSVLVMGLGAIGLMCVMVARAAGAVEILGVDVSPAKVEIALSVGADAVFDGRSPQLVQEILAPTSHPRGVDVALEVSGNAEALRECLHLTRNGGEVRALGIPTGEVGIDLARDVIFKGITLRGITGRRMFETWYQMESLLSHHLLNLDPLITREVPISRFEDAFALLDSGRAVKVILNVEDWADEQFVGAAAAERAGGAAGSGND